MFWVPSTLARKPVANLASFSTAASCTSIIANLYKKSKCFCGQIENFVKCSQLAELIQKLAAESGFDENYVKEAGEYTPGGFLASAFTDRSFGLTNEDLLWKLQYRIIRELAEKESCVIVGRCADFILQDRTDCLKVFVHADMKFRANRIVQVYGEREKSPEARLKEKDKRRAAYYRFYTDMKWGDAANYHIALDSGVIGIEKCAKVIESLA